MSDSFQIFRGSSILLWSRRVCGSSCFESNCDSEGSGRHAENWCRSGGVTNYAATRTLTRQITVEGGSMTVLGGHRGVAAFALSVAVLVTGACGGSDGASSSDDKSTTTEAGEMSTTTVKSTTTTVAPRAEADDATKERAQAGTLQLADFGEGWTEFAPGSVWTPTDESCAYRAGGGPEDALLNGSVVGGPTLRLGENDAYVSSRSYAFPTEADAIAWVEIAKTDEWAECRRVEPTQLGR